MNWFRNWRKRSSSAVASEPEGVQGFNLAAVYVLGKLYASFPVECDFRLLREQIGMAVDAAVGPGDEKPAHELTARYLPHTLRWLESEGYIRVRDKNLAGDYISVDLTERAMRVLQQVPKALRGEDGKKSLGQSMREAATEKVVSFPFEVASDLIKALISASS